MAAVSAGTLTDMYRSKGYWRAAFAEPTIALNECDGVALTVNVKEGEPYDWDHATWTGNTAFPSETLDKALAMKPGEAADQHKIDNGLRSVHQEYAKRGYLLENATYAPQLNDATHRATFAVNVQEDAQYTMGTLEVVGIRDSDAAKLQKQWSLKSGEPFDDGYMKKYQNEVLDPLQGANGKRPVIGMTLDREHHVVNLRVELR
jgi:outer membrane protein assembly factor BamA